MAIRREQTLAELAQQFDVCSTRITACKRQFQDRASRRAGGKAAGEPAYNKESVTWKSKELQS